MTRRLLIILSLLSLTFVSYSQNVAITGESPNYYLKVDEVFANSVRITETLPGQLVHFSPGDKVMIIQMTGVSIDSSAGYKTRANRLRGSLGNTGRFEILQVDDADVSGVDTILYFTDNFTHTYDNGEKIQLVKVIEGETVTINGTLTAKSWNGEVGGILAVLGIDSIKLSSNSVIDVSRKGFRGGIAPAEIYPEGLCRNGLDINTSDTLYFRPDELFRSGNKGEGIILADWPYTKGTAFNINGGGAGNGLFAGGGGGSNYLAGGDGGQQSASCTGEFSSLGGWGGYSCYDFYFNPEIPRIIFGGGGGSGNNKIGSTPSNGGNGGGMAVLITGTLVNGSNVRINANGGDGWPSSTTGSGAGGGAGGTILFDATTYTGPAFTVQIKGGTGSSTTNAIPNCNGAGGGGSGGVFWHAGGVSPDIVLDSVTGPGGISSGGSGYPDQLGLPGLQGVRLKDLIVPLTGFLFNTVRGTDTICATQIPEMLTASQPKGGNGIFTYQWQQSTDKVAWSAAAGVKEMRSLAPVALAQTTYYRRIVSSENPVTYEMIYDTSRVIEVFVYPAVSSNTISGTDTICYNGDAKPLSGSGPAGGNGTYSYMWQSSTDQALWNNQAATPAFDPSSLTQTTSYRRIVNSTAYCSDTSALIEVAVLPSITQNTFEIVDTAICENSSPGRILMNNPGGGDGKYFYEWQFRNSGSWNSIALTSDSAMYTEGNISLTTAYRRIVYSGYNNACIDTSEISTVNIKPLISNNFITGSGIKYTCYNSPASLTGSDPQNGFGPGTYAYLWEESDDNLAWQPVSATTHDYLSDNLTATRYFRRKVFSTPQYHECSSVSQPVEVRINPLPEGNVFNASDTLCAGSELYVKFNVSGNGPFNVSVSGENEPARSLSGISGPVDSILFSPQATQEFVLAAVEDDSGCFADISAFVPVVAGIVYEVPAANAGADVEICDNTHTLEAVKTNTAFNGVWTGNNVVFSDSTLENTEASIDLFGTYVFTWTETNWECTDNDDVQVIFYEQPQIPDAGPDQDLVFKYTTNLQASAPTAGSGTWTVSSGSGEFNDPAMPDAVISQLSDNTVLKWTVSNGNCPAVSDSLKIIIRPLEIKKGFTPNGDGRNDFFDLGAVHAENIEIKVFNRSGQLVYESDNYCASETGLACDKWAGYNDNNVELPEGAYFYIVNIKVAGKTEKVQFRSFVEILR